MIVRKFQHACFTVEQDDRSVVVDPGVWSDDFVTPENAVAIIITHEHQDHLDESKIREIVKTNPETIIVSHSDVISQLSDMNTKVVNPNESISISGFQIEFFGGEHAAISPDRPAIANLGVMINDKLYYGGDSFATPNKHVDLLALPISAPWMKYSEAEAYLQSVKPKIVFPTHDAILSDHGKELADRMMSDASKKIDARYERLSPNEPLEI